MRRSLAIAVALALALTCAYAQDAADKTPMFRALQFSYVMGNGLDLGMTYVAVGRYGYNEMNPVGRFILKNTAIAFAAEGALSMGFVWATNAIWKSNKTLACILAGVAVLVKGAVIYHNVRVLERSR